MSNKQQIKDIPFMVKDLDNRSFHFGTGLEFKISSNCSIFDETAKTDKKIKRIYVEWMETHWFEAMVDDPKRELKKGDIYSEEIAIFARAYSNETFAKAFAMSLMLGQTNTKDLDPDCYEHWDGFDPNDNDDNLVAVRIGSYPDMTDKTYRSYADNYLDLSERERRMMKPDRLVIMNYEFE